MDGRIPKTEKAINAARGVILRPLALFSLSFFAVSCVLFPRGGRHLLLPFLICFALAAAFGVLCCFERQKRKLFCTSFAAFMLSLGIAAGMFFTYHTYRVRVYPYSALDSETVSFTGTVTDTPVSHVYGDVYEVKLDLLDGSPCREKAQISGEHGFAPGDVISGSMVIRSLTDENGHPDEDGRYCLSGGAVISGEAVSISFVRVAEPDISAFFSGIRASLSSKLTSLLGSRNGGFCSALILGERSALSDEISRDFSRLGISHVLALSGLHLSVICSLLYFATRHLALWLKKLLRFAVPVFYMFLTGFSASVTRAGIMLLLILIAGCFRRKADMFTDIGLAVFIICIFDPFAPFDVGLQLSAASVLAIAFATGAGRKREILPPKRDKGIKKAGKAVLEGIYISISVILFIMPVSCLYYSYTSPAAPFASFIVSFLASLILYLLVFLLILLPAPTFAAVLAYPVRWLCTLTLQITGKLSLIPHVSVCVRYTGSYVLCILSFIFFILFAVSRKKCRIVSGAVSFALFCALVYGGYLYGYGGGKAYIDCPNHGKNDAVTVCYKGKSVLIDVGDGKYPVLADAADTISSRGIPETDDLVLTHLHQSYTVSLKRFFGENVVRRLHVPYTKDDRDVFEDLRFLCEEMNVEFVPYDPGDPISFCGIVFENLGYSYTDRSVQPVIRFDLCVMKCRIAYVGSSFFEASPATVLSGTDAVIYGSHGPVCKKEFSPVDAPDHAICCGYIRSFLTSPTDVSSFVVRKALEK